MTIFRVMVLEIRARSDFFTIVDPNYIEITRRTNYFTGQFNFSTIFSLDRFQMIYDRRRTWLETWFFAWCCSKKMGKILFSLVIFWWEKKIFRFFSWVKQMRKKFCKFTFLKATILSFLGFLCSQKAIEKN